MDRRGREFPGVPPKIGFPGGNFPPSLFPQKLGQFPGSGGIWGREDWKEDCLSIFAREVGGKFPQTSPRKIAILPGGLPLKYRRRIPFPSPKMVLEPKIWSQLSNIAADVCYENGCVQSIITYEEKKRRAVKSNEEK